MARRFAKFQKKILKKRFFYPSDLVNTKTTIPVKSGGYIYLDASRLSIYPPLFTSPSGDSCITLFGGGGGGELISQSLLFGLGPSVYGMNKFSLQIMTNQIRHGDPSTSWLVHIIDQCSCKIRMYTLQYY